MPHLIKNNVGREQIKSAFLGFRLYDLAIWLFLGLLIGVPIGLASALFLYCLDWVTQLREMNLWLIVLLPISGILIGYLYFLSDAQADLGNNLIFQEYFFPQKRMPFIMAPLILFTTLLSHLVGASVGREGTAIQMGAVIADRFSFLKEKFNQERGSFLMAGVGAGFASLFGTPWAGAIFALEILRTKTISWHSILPTLITSFMAYFTCTFTQAPHTKYAVIEAPEFTFGNLSYLFFLGAIFGLTAYIYIQCHHFFSNLAQKMVSKKLWRPFVGGVALFLVYWFLDDSRYMGLGIPTIIESFQVQVQPYDFVMKLVLTAFALGFGFKGGEVTPLFFMGATLGNALATFVPLPTAFVASLGFISLFSGATKTFIACTVMGAELFGLDAVPYYLLVTFLAQLFSGKASIYRDQPGNKLSIFG
jgi:H+/Cl- antiporter ClcA